MSAQINNNRESNITSSSNGDSTPKLEGDKKAAAQSFIFMA